MWKHGLCFIGVIKTEMWQFMMAYLSNIDFHNHVNMSGLLTIPVDRKKLVLVFLVVGWIGTVGTSFLLGDQLIKGVRTLARDGGKRNLTKIQSPIWLI